MSPATTQVEFSEDANTEAPNRHPLASADAIGLQRQPVPVFGEDPDAYGELLARVTKDVGPRARIRDSHRQRAADWRLLETLERYERRALSRRATAVNALDDALAARAQP